jgi:hypothetical protein
VGRSYKMATERTRPEHLAVMSPAEKRARSDARVSALLDGIPEERRGQVSAKLGQMPVSMRRTYLEAIGGRSPASAMKAFCQECVGWVKEEVRLCTGLGCPLWGYRPYQGGVEEEEAGDGEADNAG